MDMMARGVGNLGREAAWWMACRWPSGECCSLVGAAQWRNNPGQLMFRWRFKSVGLPSYVNVYELSMSAASSLFVLNECNGHGAGMLLSKKFQVKEQAARDMVGQNQQGVWGSTKYCVR